MAAAKKKAATPKKTTTKPSSVEFYWNWSDSLRDAVEAASCDSIQNVLKQTVNDHLDNGDEGAEVHIWKVEKVAVKKLKTIVQITD